MYVRIIGGTCHPTVDSHMLFNIVGYKIDGNCESWNCLIKNCEETVLPKVRGRLPHTLGQGGY